MISIKIKFTIVNLTKIHFRQQQQPAQLAQAPQTESKAVKKRGRKPFPRDQNGDIIRPKKPRSIECLILFILIEIFYAIVFK